MAMSKLHLLAVICCLLCGASLFASGKKDADEQKPLNEKWLLCITAFDYSELPSDRRIAGEVLARNLVDRLTAVNYRLRLSPEYAYYEGYAWQQAMSAAAKSLANKYNERSQLIYRGDQDWKYRANLKKIDADIVKLEEEFRKKEAEKPLIESEPVFGLTQANINGTFPSPPQKGSERRFCQSQNVDAFLTGQVREFHNRFYIKLRLFALYTNSWVYEDDIIFSLEDTEESVEEIASRLNVALSSSKPSSVAVRVEPPDAQILINRSYAGRGIVEARERPPGTIIIALAAEDYAPMIVETELVPGEHTEIDAELVPLHYSDVTVDASSKARNSFKRIIPDPADPSAFADASEDDAVVSGADVYFGALYVGQAPYHLRLPIDQLTYVTVEGRNGERAQGVFSSPDMPGESFDINLKSKMPYPPGQRRVNKARYNYYWAWAGTWITGIAAWVTNGIYTSHNAVLQNSYDPDFYNGTQRLQYISYGTMIALGAAVVNEIFWMARYIYTSTENAVPIVKKAKEKRE